MPHPFDRSAVSQFRTTLNSDDHDDTCNRTPADPLEMIIFFTLFQFHGDCCGNGDDCRAIGCDDHRLGHFPGTNIPFCPRHLSMIHFRHAELRGPVEAQEDLTRGQKESVYMMNDYLWNLRTGYAEWWF
ncbi:hypothetical protein Q8F55_006052 [Vanrija albida]|uniref:Uncharacterized protein n=1 Tax=Vanrija albida TaxID=181172 RepID=A0ABR3Q3C1_9TREE